MEKTLTNFQIMSANQAIGQLNENKFSTSTAFKLASIAKSLSEAIEIYEEQRKKILDEHAKKDENGEYRHPEDEDGNELADRVDLKDSEKFNKEMNNLAQEEVKINFKVDADPSMFDDEEVKVKMEVLVPLLSVFED